MEVFENVETLPEVRLDGDFDGAPGGIRHKASHAGERPVLVMEPLAPACLPRM
jgi:hypothetical protein